MSSAAAAAPSSCLLHFQRARFLHQLPPGAPTFREPNPRYSPTFLRIRRAELEEEERRRRGRGRLIARAVDEEGFYVQEEQDHIHPRYPFSHQFNPVDERTRLQKLAGQLQKLTPPTALTLASAGALIWALSNALLHGLILNSRLWTSATRLLILWPWPAALLVGAGTILLALKRHERLRDRSYPDRERDRDSILLHAGALLWLILVPMGHFQGYLEGFPIIFYALYLRFFTFEREIRDACYDRYYPRPPQEDWIIPQDRASWIGFVGCIIAGHWLAAFEAPPLIRSWGFGWHSALASIMAAAALLMKYWGTGFLLKYSKTVDQPERVVPYGAFRWVRHPIYGSSIILFSSFCIAVRAYGSLALILAGCLFYYEQLTKREEELLLSKFGGRYAAYKSKVRKKYIPYLF